MQDSMCNLDKMAGDEEGWIRVCIHLYDKQVAVFEGHEYTCSAQLPTGFTATGPGLPDNGKDGGGKQYEMYIPKGTRAEEVYDQLWFAAAGGKSH